MAVPFEDGKQRLNCKYVVYGGILVKLHVSKAVFVPDTVFMGVKPYSVVGSL
jgi:hypothetical protein